MVVTDLDGTLLRKDKTISDYTAAVFENCHNKDIKIVFATARPERNTANFSNTIAPNAIIANNGAKVSCGNEILMQNIIDPINVKNIVSELLKIEGIRINLDYDHVSITNCEDYLNWGNWGARYSDFSQYDPLNVQKIAIEAIDIDLLGKVNFDKYGCHFYANQGKKWYMATEKSSTKINAIKFIAKYFDISLEEIVAFGDDYNDITMLQNCGIGVAVSNAISEVKSVANYICDSNDNDGVAKWLEENVL